MCRLRGMIDPRAYESCMRLLYIRTSTFLRIIRIGRYVPVWRGKAVRFRNAKAGRRRRRMTSLAPYSKPANYSQWRTVESSSTSLVFDASVLILTGLRASHPSGSIVGPRRGARSLYAFSRSAGKGGGVVWGK